MAAPFLVPCLAALRWEFNELAPDRDHTSDGWIGDAAHQQEPSDHNPDDRGAVHAIDVDRDLRREGWSMERAVQLVVGRHRLGADDRLHYVIFDRRIWASDWGWTEREYDGPNPHDKHAHFSSVYTAQQASTRQWGLLEADIVRLDPADIQLIAEAVAARFKIGDKGMADKLGDDLNNDKSGIAVGVRRQARAVKNEETK